MREPQPRSLGLQHVHAQPSIVHARRGAHMCAPGAGTRRARAPRDGVQRTGVFVHSAMRASLRAAAALMVAAWHCAGVEAKVVVIHNDVARRDVDGNYVDAHDGKIVHVNGTYFLYGEAYGNQTLATPYPWKQWPRLNVYTSPDLVSWTLRGDPLPMVKTTLWIPNVLYDAKTQRFIMWYGAGVWATATSTDGINFVPAGPPFASRFGMAAQTDGTGIFIDDDGQGYVAFAVTAPPFDMPDHKGWPGKHTSPHSFILKILSPCTP